MKDSFLGKTPLYCNEEKWGKDISFAYNAIHITAQHTVRGFEWQAKDIIYLASDLLAICFVRTQFLQQCDAMVW